MDNCQLHENEFRSGLNDLKSSKRTDVPSRRFWNPGRIQASPHATICGLCGVRPKSSHAWQMLKNSVQADFGTAGLDRSSVETRKTRIGGQGRSADSESPEPVS